MNRAWGNAMRPHENSIQARIREDPELRERYRQNKKKWDEDSTAREGQLRRLKA